MHSLFVKVKQQQKFVHVVFALEIWRSVYSASTNTLNLQYETGFVMQVRQYRNKNFA